MEFVTLEQIAELQEAAQKGCLYSLTQLEQVQSKTSPQGLELPSAYRPDGSPREWGDYGDND